MDTFYTSKTGLALLRGWVRRGYTTEQLLEHMGVEREEFAALLQEPSIKEVLLARENEDALVESALFSLCVGQVVQVQKAVKVKKISYDNGKKLEEVETVEMVTEETYVPPSLNAQIYWLKNRQPTKWSDKKEEETDKKEGGDFIIEIVGEKQSAQKE